MYHAALANGFLYDPGRGGTIFKINKTTGAVVKRINPFGTHHQCQHVHGIAV